MQAFDYIIVGGGSAGCVLASRLSEDPSTRVLLVEAGGKDNHVTLKMPVAFLKAMTNPAFGWGLFSQPEPRLGGRRLWLPRGKVLGGSSSINGMFYMRGHPLDYEEWQALGAQGWGYADVLPYFRKMEKSWRGAGKYHGDSGRLHVAPIDTSRLHGDALMATAQAAGFSTSDDLSGDHPEGFAVGEVTIDPKGRRASSSTAYLAPAAGRPNLEVVTNARVNKVLLLGRRAIGVEYERGGKIFAPRAGREVILACGTFNTPHLLMLSGIGPGDHIRAYGLPVVLDSPMVGRNLSEHANIAVEFASRTNDTFLSQLRWDRLALSSARWFLGAGGPLASQINSCNIVIRTDPSLDRPDIQFMSNPIRFEARPWWPLLGTRQRHVFWAGIVSLHPFSRGWVELASSNPRELPKVQLNLLADERDYLPLRRGIRAARHIYRTEPQASLVGEELVPGPHVESDDELDAYIRQALYVAQHPVGTCAMGSGKGAVVDSELRVIGTEALRVVDASVMPTVPGANTNAPTIMIAERASDLIRGRSPLPPSEI